MVKLVNPNEHDSLFEEMKDGDIAVVTLWNGCMGSYCVGHVVQRYENNLLVVGARSEEGWSQIFPDIIKAWDDCRIRILEPGELLEV